MIDVHARRAGLLSVLLTVALLLLVLFGVLSGSVHVPLRTIAAVLRGTGEFDVGRAIVLGIRLPRLVMAVLVGMMLSLSGTVAQAVFRNPLADPYIIGISAGAVAGAVLAFFLGLPDLFYGFFGFVTAMATALVIFRIAGKRGRSDTAMLLIVGIAVSSFLGALSSFAMYWAGEDSYRIVVWTMGYLGGASWTRVGLLLVPLVLASVYFIYLRNDVDALLLGDEEAHSLGVDVARLKRRLLLVISLIVSFSVAFSGMIGFVGLIVPHAVRLLIGSSHGRLLPFAALSGGVFLLFADTIARTLLAPTEIPIGVVTAFFGAPFFLFLAIRSGRGGYV